MKRVLSRALNKKSRTNRANAAETDASAIRQVELDALEPRVLFSGAPVEPEAESAAASQAAPAAADETAVSDEQGLIADETGLDQDAAVALVGLDETSAALNAETVEYVSLHSPLTQTELSAIAAEATARWTSTGLSADQLAALGQINYQISNLPGNTLGQAQGLSIVVDLDAANRGWFIDATPHLDEEFAWIDGRLMASIAEADGRIDLLTALMHEQGHILGLLDQVSGTTNVMSGVLNGGERRLPVAGQAVGAAAGSLEGAHEAITSATIAGDTLTIVGDAADDAISLSINAGNFEYNAGAGAVVVGATTGVTKIVVNLGDGTNTLTLDATLNAGNFAVSINGGSTGTTLFGDTARTGTTAITGGVVKLGNATALGATGLGNYTTVANNATLDLNGFSVAEDFGFAGASGDGFGGTNATLMNSSGTDAAVTGTIHSDGASNLRVDGTGTIALTRVARTNGTTGSPTVIKDGEGLLRFIGGSGTDNTAMAMTVNNGTVEMGKSVGGIRVLGAGLTINGDGVVRIVDAGGDQIVDSQSVTMNDSAVFELNGRNETVNGLTSTSATTVVRNGGVANATLTYGSSNATTTFAGVMENGSGGGTLGLTKIGTGTLTLTNANTYTGITRIGGTGGGLTLDFAAVGGPTDNIVHSGSVMNLGNTSAVRNQVLTINGEAGLTNSQTFNGTEVLSAGAGNRHQIVVNSGAGGTMNVNLGLLTVASGAFLDIVLPASGDISVSNADGVLPATVTLNNGATFAQIVGGKVVAFHGNLVYQTATDIGAIPGYTTASTLLVDNTSTGNVTTAAGTTQLAAINLTDSANRTIDIAAGETLRLGGPGAIIRGSAAGDVTIGTAPGTGTISSGTAAGADLVFNNQGTSGTMTVNSIIANNAGGAVDVFYRGAGGTVTVVTGANTYTGATDVQSGIVRIASNTAFGTTAGNVEIHDGATVELSGNITVGEAFSSALGTGVGGNGVIRNVSGSNTLTGLTTITGAATITVDAGSTLTYDRTTAATSLTTNSSVIFNVAGELIFNDPFVTTGTTNPTVTKNGSGILTFNAANNWVGTGGLAINGGIVRITNSSAINGGTGTGGTTIAANAALEISNNISITETITLTNSSGIANGGAIRVTGGSNTISGIITANSGTANRIQVEAGATLNLTNATAALRTENNQPRAVTLGGAGNYVISGTVANQGTGVLALNKDGAGSLTLSGANTFTGATTIHEGTLFLDYSTSSASKLSDTAALTLNGATLDFTGAGSETIGSLVIGAGESNSVILGSGQSLTVTSTTASLGAGSTLLFDLRGGGVVNWNPALTNGIIAANVLVQDDSGIGVATVSGGQVVRLATTLLPETGGSTTVHYLVDNHDGTDDGSDEMQLTGNVDTASVSVDTTARPGTLDLNGFLLTASSLHLVGGNAYNIGGTVAGSGIRGTTTNDTVTISNYNGAGAITINAPILANGTGGLTIFNETASGQVSFGGTSGASTYTGATTVSGGTLRLTTDDALSTTTALDLGGPTGTVVAFDLANASQQVGALTVNTNSTTASTITIGAGETLTATGNVRIGSSVSGLTTTNLDVSGAGSFVVNNSISNGSFQVGATTSGSNGSVVTADFSDLSTMEVNLTGTSSVITVNPVNGTNVNGLQSTLILADTSTLRAATLSVGGSATNNTGTQLNSLLLGSTANTIHANTINIGTGGRDIGSIAFNESTGSITIRGLAGGTTRANVNIGTGNATTGAAATLGNSLLLAGHSADLMLGTLTLGGQNRNTDRTDTLSFDTGTFDVTTVVVGDNGGTANASAINNIWTATLSLGGGATTIGTGGIDIAKGDTAVTGTDTILGSVNISGGNVTVGNNTTFGAAIRMANNTIATGLTTTAELNLTGGVTTVLGNIIKGTSTGAGTATVTLAGGSLDMSGNAIGSGTASVTLEAESGTLSNLGALNGGGTLTKTTGGTLILAGAGNTHTGLTSVAEGTLLVNGTHTGGGDYSVASGATLGGAGTIGANVSVASGAILATGATVGGIGTLTIDGNLSLAGTLAYGVAAGPGQSDLLNVDGDLDITSATLDLSGFAGSDKSYTIATYTGTLTGASFATVTGLPTGYAVVYDNANGEIRLEGPAVIVTQSGGSTNVAEGGATDTFTVVLTGAPASNVLVTVTPDGDLDLGAGAGIAIVLTFTPLNATTAQTVTVTAFNDTSEEGFETGAITLSVASGDSLFNALTPDVDGSPATTLPVSIIDNDSSKQTLVTVDAFGVLNITDINTETADDLTLTFDGTHIEITDPGTTFDTGLGATLINPTTVRVLASSVTGINIVTANPTEIGASDTVSLVSLPPSLSGAVTVSAETIELGTNLSADSITLNGNVILTANVVITVASASSISGTVSGAGFGIEKAGAGSLSLGNAAPHTHTGATTVSGGTVALSGFGTIASSSAITVGSGATLDVSGLTAASFTVGGATAQVLAGSGTVEATGKAVVVDTMGTLQPGGAATGTLTINGNLSLAGGNAFQVDGALPSDRVNVTGTVTLSGSLSLSGTAPAPGSTITLISNDGTDPVTGTFASLAEGATVTVGADTYFISYVGGDGNDVVLFAGAAETEVSLDGSGNLTITDINSASENAITVSFDSGTSEWVISDAGQVISLSGLAAGTFTRPSASEVRIDAAVVTGNISIVAGSGTDSVTIPVTSGALNVTGNLSIEAETISIATAITTGGSQTYTGNAVIGTALALQGTTVNVTGTTSLGANALTLNVSGATSSLDGIVSGTGGSLAVAGGGTLSLVAANTYTGSTSIGANTTLAISNNTALGTTAGGVTVASEGVLQLSGGITVGAEALNLIGGSLVNLSGTNSFAGAITINQASGGKILSEAGLLTVSGATNGSAAATALEIGGAGDITISGSVGTNVNSLLKSGGGTTTFTADPNMGGTFTIAAGTVILNHSGATDANIVVQSGAILRNIGDNRIGDNTDITVESGGTFDVQGSDTFRSLLGAGLVTNDSAAAKTLTVGQNNPSFTFDGVIQNGVSALALTKTGTGTMVLTNTNLYTGTTTVSNGILALRGDNASIAGSAQITLTTSLSRLEVGAASDTVGTTNRIGDTTEIELQDGAEVFFFGSDAANYTESIGQIETNSGHNTVTLNAGAGREIQVNATSILRSSSGTLLVRGDDLGAAAGTLDSSRLLVATAPSGSNFRGGGGAAGTATQSVVPWVVGDTVVNGSGTALVTHDATNGLRPLRLTASEYLTTIAPGTTSDNISLSGLVSLLGGNATINGLRLEDGANLTLAPGLGLTLNSGSLVNASTNGTLSGGQIRFGTVNGLIHNSGADAMTPVTFVVDTGLSGTGGLTFTAGNPGSVTSLEGPSSVTGQYNFNQGIVQLGHTYAFNPFTRNAMIFASESSLGDVVLRLNGVSISEGSIGSQTTGTIENGADVDATITIDQTSDRDAALLLRNGGGLGVLNLVKTGASRLSFNSTNTFPDFTGTATVRAGTLDLRNQARWTAVSEINVEGGTFQLHNTNGGNSQTDRLPTTALINLSGGTFSFSNNAEASTSYSETVGALNALAGVNTVSVTTAASGRNAVLIFNPSNATALSTNLVRQDGAIVNFVTNGTNVLGNSIRARVQFGSTTAPTGLNDGLIGGYAVVTDNNGLNWATISGDLDTGTTGIQHSVTGLATYQTSTDATTWAAADNVRLAAALSTLLSGAKTVNSLILNDGIDLDLNGQTLTVDTGGILGIHTASATDKTISNGSLTAGGSNEIILRIDNSSAASTIADLILSANLTDNGNAVTLTKWGAGDLKLTGTGNTFSGDINLTQGSLIADSLAALGTGTGRTIRLAGGSTLNLSGSTASENLGTSFDAIVVNTIGNATVRGATGQTLTYAGSLSGIGGLVFQNAVDASISGDIDLRSGGLSIGTNDTTTVLATAAPQSDWTVASGTHVIGGGLSVGTNQRLASVSVAGGSLTVGFDQIGSNLDIGVRTIGTGTGAAANTEGTLDLSGTTDFSARVDNVRIGIVTTTGSNGSAEGDLILGTNSHIVAGTQFILGNSADVGNTVVGESNSVVFGSGSNTLLSPLITIGGMKSVGVATIAAGGTLEIADFDGEGAVLYVGRNNVNTGVSNSGTMDLTGGTLNATLNNLVIAEKTSGGNAGSTGILTLGSVGNEVVTNALTIGSMAGAANNAAAIANGTLNMSTGTLDVRGDVTLGLFTGTSGTAKGTLSLTGGTLTISGNLTKTDNDRSAAIVTIDGASAILDLQRQADGDASRGNLTASQLNFIAGTITDVESINLDAENVTTGTAFAELTNALVLGDVTLTANSGISLTGETANAGGIQYQAGTTGATIDTTLNLGSVARRLDIGNGGASIDLEITGAISGSAMEKTGTGTLNLSGDNLYAGTTTVTAGTLLVNGAHTGGASYTVASGATLGGAGTIGAAVSIASGATLATGATPGGIGTLTIEGNTTIAGTLAIGASPTPGDADLLMVDGDLDITGATLDLSAFAGTDDSYTIATYTGTLTGAFTPVAIPSGYALQYSAGQIELVKPAVLVTQPGGTTAVTEGGATDSLSVVLQGTPAVGETVTVTFAPVADLDLGAGAGVAVTRTFTSANPLVTQTVTVTATDDAIVEALESGAITISVTSDLPGSDFDGTLIKIDGSAGSTVTASITDNDTAVATIVASTATAAEGGTAGQFTVSLSSQSSTDTVVHYTVSGTALSGSDFTPLSGSVTIAAGQMSATIDVTATDDALLESAETVIVTLTGITGDTDITVGGANEATVTIADNDTASASLSATTNGAEGSTDIVFTVTLDKVNHTGSAIVFDFDDLGTGLAISGSDYTALPANAVISVADGSSTGTITVAVTDDVALEASETVIAQISNASLGSVSIATASATATITDNDTAVANLSVTTHGVEGGTDIVFTVTLTKINETGSPITFDLADLGSGTATSGLDYNAIPPGAQISVASGASTGTFTVTVSDDTLVEALETLTAQISNPSNGAVTIGTASATANISDNDTAEASIAATTQAAEPGTDGLFTVTLTNASSTDTVIAYTVSGTATAGSDYTAL
ncbi:MAG: autotransporter-associated beta strand repeat-containing protein, partial [Verrucomicrobiales bacterium]|nr:autotransporter-associated beta strand repeat-containing protein [Verrucomicrobiales bacterium]